MDVGDNRDNRLGVLLTDACLLALVSPLSLSKDPILRGSASRGAPFGVRFFGVTSRALPNPRLGATRPGRGESSGFAGGGWGLRWGVCAFMHSHSRMTIDHRISWTEHIGFSLTRHTLRAPSTNRGGMFAGWLQLSGYSLFVLALPLYDTYTLLCIGVTRT